MKRAHYGLNVRVVSRGKGHSVVQAGAYQSGERLHDKRVGATYDYGALHRQRESATVGTALLTPDDAGEWARERESFYNGIEAACGAKNAQLARWVRMNIPREVPEGQRMDMVVDFVRREFVDRGMCADVALQVCRASDGRENPHAHVILTMRRIMADGSYAAKASLGREWNALFTRGEEAGDGTALLAGSRREEGFANRKGAGDGYVRSRAGLVGLRERWAAHVNRWLEDAGANARCSHESHKALGLGRKAQPYMGRAKYGRDGAAHAAIRAVKRENRLVQGKRFNDSGKAREEAETIARSDSVRRRASVPGRSAGRGGNREWDLAEEWEMGR